MNANTKNKMNLILSVSNNFLYFLSKSFFDFSCFKTIIISWDNAKFFINISNNFAINVEYNVWGIWYKKLNLPSSSYILWIVSSVKNKALIVKSKQKEKKKGKFFIIFIL